jgi:hypothetical protein
MTLVLAPDAGGRLISAARAGGREVLWRDRQIIDDDFRVLKPRETWPVIDGRFSSWTNVGGEKTWPAPQGWAGAGEWPGPPDPVLDAGSWDVRSSRRPNGMTIELTSPMDMRTGLRISRTFELSDRGPAFTLRTTFENATRRPIRWSIWEVCQVDASGRGTVHVSSADDSVVDLGRYRGRLRMDAPTRGRFSIAYQDVVGKVGFPSATGAISYIEPDGHGLSVAFSPVHGSDYPDHNSRAELWMESPQPEPIEELSGLHPRQNLVELEVLSPLVTLQAGHYASLETVWTLT